MAGQLHKSIFTSQLDVELALVWYSLCHFICGCCDGQIYSFFFFFGVTCVLEIKGFDTCGWLSLLSSSGISRGEMQPPRHGSVRVDHRRGVSTNSLFREIYDDSEDEDDEVGYADPVQDDLYARKMGIKPQPTSSVSYDKFLPKFWTPEEDIHIQKIKLGSQRRPWYKKIQGFRCVRAYIYIHIYTILSFFLSIA